MVSAMPRVSTTHVEMAAKLPDVIPSIGPTKSTWVTRWMPRDLRIEWRHVAQPGIGDLLLCEVITPSLHGRVETVDGARAKLYPGDRIITALGNRYATSLIEGVGEVAGSQIDLLSASGVSGRSLSLAEKSAPATRLRVLGQAFRGEHPMNVRDFARPRSTTRSKDPWWVVVVGSSMDSGKTTACASLIHGLADGGLRVGAAKLTGTASSRDVGSYRDAGADPVVDFLDSGWPSTAGCTPSELMSIVKDLRSRLAAAEVDVAVLEIADGLLQVETRQLLADILTVLDDPAVVLTVGESLSGVAGVEMLRNLGHRVIAVSGLVTNSPLAMREIENTASIACVRTGQLARNAVRLIGWSVSREAPPLARAAG